MSITRQLAAYSPLSLRAIFAATAQTVGADDPRPRLIELLKKKYGASDVFLTASGTQALTLAITAAQDQPKKEGPVALPAYSCYDLASAALATDAAVALYDVDPDTLSPDLTSLENVLQRGAATVVVAPLYGIPVDWPAVTQLADRYDALVINDAAQCIGATFDGTPVAALGEMAILSFGRGKGWTGGHGGALLVRERTRELTAPRSARVADDVTNIVALAAQWCLGRPSLYGLPASIPSLRLGETVYRPPETPRSLARGAAATIIETADAAEHEAEVRRVNAATLINSMRGDGTVRLLEYPPAGTAGYLRLPLRLANGIHTFGDRSAAEQRGIAPGYPTTLGELTPLRSRLTDPTGSWPGASTLARELVTLPTHSRLEASDIIALKALIQSL